MKRHADWKGMLRRRWRWAHMRREWGRSCYITNCMGDTLDSWWEWESQ